MSGQIDLFAAGADPFAADLEADELRAADDGTTLAAARRRFFAELDDGRTARCACCDRLGTKDVRTIHSTMAAGLLVLAALERAEGRSSVHVREIVGRLRHKRTTNPSADFAKLRWWGLIEPAEVAARPGQKTAGLWRLTQRGRDFVEGAATVPRKIVRWNKETEGFDGERISIRDALGDAWNYDELLANRRAVHTSARVADERKTR